MNIKKEIFNKRNITIFGYKYLNLFNELNSSTSIIKIFSKKPQNPIHYNYQSLVEKYSFNTDISRCRSNLVILDNDATKALIAGYPLDSNGVLISLNKPKYWVFIFIGLIRRLLLGHIKIINIINLKIKNKKTFWLYLKTINKRSGNDYYFSEKIGIQGLLNFLKKEKINYVVMRFYQKLPKLYDDEDSDLDILVSNDDEEILKKYLITNKGNLKIDIWNESAPSYSGVSYYLPVLAKKILDNSIDGPANSKIPSKKHALLSLIYHSLYHKGINSGIPSSTIKIKNFKKKYLNEIKNLEKELNQNVGSTMEEMETYLKDNEWQPKIDTLAKFALWNEWVRVRYFDKNNSDFKMRVFIFKEIILKKKLLKKIQELIKNEEFILVDEKKLEGEIKKNSTINLRGGIWKDLNYNSDSTDYNPAYAMILMDTKSNKINRFTTLKDKIRKVWNGLEGSNIVHSSDTNIESWEYIACCFPDKISEVKKKMIYLSKNKKYNSKFSFSFFIKSIPYYKAYLKAKFKSHIINILE
tara:strand:+ start:292 stop:1869 length:1578 start_codon:yes stop_codon:yes gene_type:complete